MRWWFVKDTVQKMRNAYMWKKLISFSLPVACMSITLCLILVFYNVYVYNRAMDTYITFIGPSTILLKQHIGRLDTFLPLRYQVLELSKSSYCLPIKWWCGTLCWLYIVHLSFYWYIRGWWTLTSHIQIHYPTSTTTFEHQIRSESWNQNNFQTLFGHYLVV